MAEPIVQISDLNLQLGDFRLRDFELEVFAGEYLVILGPTGAGKTVLLDCILGIHRPRKGTICLDGKDVTKWLPEDRNVGYVPQDYALFPTMTVEENVGYGPYVRHWPEEKRKARVDELITLLGIEKIRHRLPTALSGGEKQRVAVGRALAVHPAILLLDEPLSALDEIRRSELAREFRAIQKKVGATFLHICHNLDEATEVADRLAIVRNGQVIQIGTVEEVLRKPQSPFVAQFTGCANVFHVSPHKEGYQLDDGMVLQLEERLEQDAHVAIRPELLQWLEDDSKAQEQWACVVKGEVTHKIERVSSHYFEVQPYDSELQWKISIARQARENSPTIGESLTFAIPQEAIHLMERD